MESPKITLDQLCEALDRTISRRWKTDQKAARAAGAPAVRRVVGGLDDIYAVPAAVPVPVAPRPEALTGAARPKALTGGARPKEAAMPDHIDEKDWTFISTFGVVLSSDKGGYTPPSNVLALATARAERLKLKIVLDKVANTLKTKGEPFTQVSQADLRCIVAFGKGWYDNLVADPETLLPYLLSELLPADNRFWEMP